MSGVTEYQHRRLGFRMAAPDGWELAEDTHGVVLIAVEPALDPPRFRPNLVVTVDELVPGVTPQQWHVQGLELLRQQLTGFWVIDLTSTEVGGQPVYRTLGHHTTESGAITMEQWLRFDERHCYTLTASVGTLDYSSYFQLFRSIASSLRLPGEVQ
jgi:hypothetical protein